MTSYAVAATPPSTAGRRDGKYWHIPVYPQHQQHQHQPLCTSPSPSPWVDAPPTPQDSQASACHSPGHSPRTLPALLAENVSLSISSPIPAIPDLSLDQDIQDVSSDDDFDDDNIQISNGNAAMTASLRRSQPTLITIGPKIVSRENRHSIPNQSQNQNRQSREFRVHQDIDDTNSIRHSTNFGKKGNSEHRMQQWLSEIPAPVTPQERYIQGLNPTVDHPLHPRPLRAVVPSRQVRYLSSTELSIEDDNLSAECEKLTIAGSDKENGTLRDRFKSLDSRDRKSVV